MKCIPCGYLVDSGPSLVYKAPSTGAWMQAMREEVREVLEHLRDSIALGEEDRAVLGHLQFSGHRDKLVVLETAPGLVTFAQERLLPHIQESLRQRVRLPVEVRIRAVRSPQRELFPVLDDDSRAADTDATSNEARPSQTFDDFVVGGGNQFAHAAALAVATNPGTQYNPLLLYGGVGLGKTHLLRAIATRLREDHPDWRVRYVTADSFMAELVQAIRADDVPRFKTRFQHLDALLFDDVQLLAGRERTQEEFFHTFNALYERGKQLVLTSDRPPNELLGLQERLRNRFQWGLVADIQPPDLETRIAILQRKAEAEGTSLPEDVALFIAEHARNNIRELQGAFTRIFAFSLLQRRDIDLALAKQVLQASSSRTMRLTVEHIQELVARFFGVRVTDLRSRRRTRAVTIPRQVAMYLCRKYLEASFPYIGEKFGGRDHTTVMHAVEAVERRQAGDHRLRAAVEALRRAIESGTEPNLKLWKEHAS